MNLRLTASVALTALCLASTALGQLVVNTVTVTGVDHGTKAKFTFRVDPTSNVLQIDVDNTIAGAQGVQGTITSFGFNTPFTDAQLGSNGSTVSIWQKWTVGAPETSNVVWNKFENYSLSGKTEDLGVGTGTSATNGGTKNGIEFGEKVTFKFTFPDFTPAQVNGFFNTSPDLLVRWQDVGIGCKDYYKDWGCADLPTTPVPEPSTYGLMGAMALIAGVTVRRRMEKKATAKKLENVSAA